MRFVCHFRFRHPARRLCLTHRNHVWTWDFIADATVRGGALKMLTILDEYTRECHVLWAERALKAADVLYWLQKAVEQHGAPEYRWPVNGEHAAPPPSRPRKTSLLFLEELG
jgi:hypothetical protein